MSTPPTGKATKRDLTPTRPIRVPLPIWDAFGRVCARNGTDRTAYLIKAMEEAIRQHGDDQDLNDLETGLRQLAERRSRMHPGRPPGSTNTR